MIVLCDSREQLPLEFKHSYVEGAETCALDVGDYGVRFQDGHIPSIYFERKSITDLFGTLGKGYARFKKEIIRSKDNKSELIIIIEGTITDVLAGTRFTKIQGIQILRTILSLWNRYQIVSVFCKDRQEAALFIAEYYLAYARKRTKEQKNAQEGHKDAV